MLLNRDCNVRSSCTVFGPHLISPTNVYSVWQLWLQLCLTVSLSSCAFQTVLFLSLTCADPSGYSGGLAVRLPFSEPLEILCTSVLLCGHPPLKPFRLCSSKSHQQDPDGPAHFP